MHFNDTAAGRPSLTSTSRPAVSRYLPWPSKGLGQDEPRTHLQYAHADNFGSMALTEMTGHSRRWWYRDNRNPILLFRLLALFLLRLAARLLLSLLFQDPPRTTRMPMQVHPSSTKIAKSFLFQPVAFAKTDMPQPGVEAILQLLWCQTTSPALCQHTAQVAAVALELRFLHPAVVRVYGEAQERYPVHHPIYLGFVGVHPQAQALQVACAGLPPRP